MDATTPNGDAPNTLVEAIRYFSGPDRCLAFFVPLRWPNGIVCPRCGVKEHTVLKTRRLWKCKGCKKQFSVQVGTIYGGHGHHFGIGSSTRFAESRMPRVPESVHRGIVASGMNEPVVPPDVTAVAAHEGVGIRTTRRVNDGAGGSQPPARGTWLGDGVLEGGGPMSRSDVCCRTG